MTKWEFCVSGKVSRTKASSVVLIALSLLLLLYFYIYQFLINQSTIKITENNSYLVQAFKKNVSSINARFWPDLENFDDDRILVQGMIKDCKKNCDLSINPKLKTFLLYNPFDDFKFKEGTSMFASCPVKECSVTLDKSQISKTDIVVFHDAITIPPKYSRPSSQIWLLSLPESPYHSPSLKPVKGLINWTATYRRDSTIASPYSKFVLFNKSVIAKRQSQNFAANKTKQVAWFVSNCNPKNNRQGYVRELSRHISVDIYGHCGSLKCPRSNKKCVEKLRTEYKFYLALENSNCRDYITEKLFENALQNDVIPIVMGAPPDDYKRAAPFHSYIHVDEFGSPKALAEYLHKLDKDDELYNGYFQWKGTGSFVSVGSICRMCALLHVEPMVSRWYDDIENWWRGDNVCIGTRSWRDVKIHKRIYMD